MIGRTDPDVVLLDMLCAGMDGLACLERIRQRPPRSVVMLSAFNEPEQITAVLKRGASGYIVKSVNPLDLPAALRQILEGTVYHALGLAEDDEPARGTGLTDRTSASSKPSPAASPTRPSAKNSGSPNKPSIPPDQHYRKLGVANRTEAARYATSTPWSEPSSRTHETARIGTRTTGWSAEDMTGSAATDGTLGGVEADPDHRR